MDTVNVNKASFDDIYDQPDPRAYFTALGALEYDIPQRANPVFEQVLQVRSAAATTPTSVLDIGCSYGVNAALLRCDLTMQDLFEHYRADGVAHLSAEELAASDRSFYDGHRRADSPRVLGLDVAGNALSYAESVGLLDDSWTEDLESAEPSADLAAGIADVGLITATGCVGYVTEQTFSRLLGATPDGAPPWVAAFVLRMFGYDEIEAVLAEHGLVTEQLPGVTFKQRRFASAQEQESATAAVVARGLDPAGKEQDGWFHADFFLSRPESDAGVPLPELLAGAGLG